jgi:hypothetical protein
LVATGSAFPFKELSAVNFLLPITLPRFLLRSFSFYEICSESNCGALNKHKTLFFYKTTQHWPRTQYKVRKPLQKK